MNKKIYLILVMVLVGLLVVGCGNGQEPAEETGEQTGEETAGTEEELPAELLGPVTVASFVDTEGSVLGNMMILLLEDNGFEVIDKTEFGTPDILRKAILSDEIDLYVDYSGSGQRYYTVEDESVWSNYDKGYNTIKALDKDNENLIWLTPIIANNTEMLAMKRDFAEANGIVDLYDFAEFVNAGNEVKLITSASFAQNIRGLAGYEEAYDFKLNENQMIVLSAGNTSEMMKALVNGTNDVNVSLVYGTDGALNEMNLVVLEDPLSIPPVYLPTPVLRGEVYEAYPEIEDILKPVFDSLNLEKMQQLNAKVAFEGQDPEDVARDYLMENGFIQ